MSRAAAIRVGAAALLAISLGASLLVLGGVPPAPELTPATAASATPTPGPSVGVASPGPEPARELRRTFVVLGIDRAHWRAGDGIRPHTDFFLVVSVAINEPPGARAAVTVLQVPRNLFVHVEGVRDDFAFGLYDQGGLPFVEWWVHEALGLYVDGAVLTRMDNFVEIVNALGGVNFEGQPMTGLEALQYTRRELWGGVYDPQSRHLRMLLALSDTVRDRAAADPVGAAALLWDRFGSLIETDLHWGPLLSSVAHFGPYWAASEYDVRFVRLDDETGVLYRGDIPFEIAGTTRGLMVRPGEDLAAWVQAQLASPDA